MVWVIVIAVIFVVLFLMILAPKAAKGYTDTEKLKDVAWGKGFKRIYFLLSALWMGSLSFYYLMEDNPTDPSANQSYTIVVFLLILAPIPIYHFIKWIFGGFKKEEKNKKKKK